MDDQSHLAHAARLAIRGHGGAEPNPMVGCVIVAPDNAVVGWGFHRRCGEAHAEINALKHAGDQARGATAYVTLEPCNHTGRTGPCSQALIDAGVQRVVIGRLDPHRTASGGVQRLREAGIVVHIHEWTTSEDGLPTPQSVLAPFEHRIETGLPWIIAKWAQTLDGKVATRAGASQWISNETSRRMVHRERGRVCAILTGIGTVLADDPLLTARNVRRRRTARRVVIDPKLDIPEHAQLVTTAREAPVTLVCRADACDEHSSKVSTLRQAGVELLEMPGAGDQLDLKAALRELVQRHELATVLVEAGTGLLSRLFHQRLVNEAWVFIGPLLLGDTCAPAAVRGNTVEQLTDGLPLELIDQRRRGNDLVVRYRCPIELRTCKK